MIAEFAADHPRLYVAIAIAAWMAACAVTVLIAWRVDKDQIEREIDDDSNGR